MNELKQEIEGLLKGTEIQWTNEAMHEFYLQVKEENFGTLISTFMKHEFVLIALFCVQARERFILHYAFEKRGYEGIAVVRRETGKETTSIAESFPTASWYEREIMDGFGIDFADTFDKRRLFLHETYPQGFHPLLKSFKNTHMETKGIVTELYQFREMSGEGIYHIPVGPVHAGIIEPGHFRFSVIGETIFNLEVRMFYKHRGIEKLAEGKSPGGCVQIAETISGDETAANAVAYCSAVEKISKCTVPARAWHLRTMMLEMERIYSHLGDLAGMVVDVAYPAGASPLFVLREEVLRLNAQLTGSRFLKGIMQPGGLAKDIPDLLLAKSLEFWKDFSQRFNKAAKDILAFPSVVDRLETTGVIKRELIAPLNITGPAARASGAAIDTRTDHPYGIYGKLQCRKRTGETGDVLARFEVKATEVNDSVALIKAVLNGLPKGPIAAQCAIADGCALSLVEAARGQNLHWVLIKDGMVERYKIRTASFCNWQAIGHAVLGNIVPDFPLINKSLNLSYAGTDL